MQTNHRLSGTALNVGLALLLAAALSTSHLLDGHIFEITDHHNEHAQAAALQDALKAEAAAQRFAQAAAALCGPNAGYLETADGSLACTTKKGKRTGVVVQTSMASAQ